MAEGVDQGGRKQKQSNKGRQGSKSLKLQPTVEGASMEEENLGITVRDRSNRVKTSSKKLSICSGSIIAFCFGISVTQANSTAEKALSCN
jgi:hypothetical protein